MITLVIVMFGLLGLAGLMAKGQRASFEAFQRQQALSFATDIAERIRSNHGLAAEYATAAPLAAPLGSGVRFAQIGAGIRNCGNDTRTSAEIMGLFEALNDSGITIMMVTHELDIAGYCKRIIVMRDGRIISDQPNETRRHSALEIARIESEEREAKLS